VCICGGTHGDERNGVHLARNFAKIKGPIGSQHGFDFELKVIESNPEATRKGVRYIEEDLNRCFLSVDLDNPTHTTLYEHRRAKEINNMLGPKSSPNPVCDYVLDLHNTSAATGVAVFMHPRDKFSQGLAAYLQRLEPSVNVALWADRDVMLLPSVGRSGMTFEVGPVSIKCMNAELYARSKRLVDAALNYIAAYNAAWQQAGPGGIKAWSSQTLNCIQVIRPVPFPRDAEQELAGMIHPAVDGKDFAPLATTEPVFLMFDGSEKSLQDVIGAIDQSTVFPFLINEASYYEKDTAFLIGECVEVSVDVLALPKL
jgi:succinylglutamate desuccinylase